MSESIRKVANSENFHGKYIGGDSSFGSDKAFLDSLPENLVYFADVHCNLEVFRSRPDMAVPEYTGRGKRPSKAAPSFIGEIMKAIDFKLKNMADSYNSHASSKIQRVLKERALAAGCTG